jgi:hypothetical protein
VATQGGREISLFYVRDVNKSTKNVNKKLADIKIIFHSGLVYSKRGGYAKVVSRRRPAAPWRR